MFCCEVSSDSICGDSTAPAPAAVLGPDAQVLRVRSTVVPSRLEVGLVRWNMLNKRAPQSPIQTVPSFLHHCFYFWAYFLNLSIELVSKNNLWLILRQQLSVSRQGTQPSTCIWCSAEPLPLLLGQSGPARAHGPTYLGCWPLSGSTWEV